MNFEMEDILMTDTDLLIQNLRRENEALRAELEWKQKEIELARLSSGVTVQEWISVDDRLPEEKVNCIVHYKHAYCNNDGYWAIGFCFYDGEKFQFNQAYKVTHWMLIPNPPEEVNDGA